MLIRLARDHWINLTLDNVRKISVEKDTSDNNFQDKETANETGTQD